MDLLTLAVGYAFTELVSYCKSLLPGYSFFCTSSFLLITRQLEKDTNIIRFPITDTVQPKSKKANPFAVYVPQLYWA